MTWEVRIKGPSHLAASGFAGPTGPWILVLSETPSIPPSTWTVRRSSRTGRYMTERGHTWMARSWGSYISFLLLDDAGPSPVDVDRQEVLEDGEVFDQDRSYQDDEAPSHSHSRSRSYAS